MTGEDFRMIRNDVLDLSVSQMATVLNVIPRTVRNMEVNGVTGPAVVLMRALQDGRLPEIPQARRGAGRPRAAGNDSSYSSDARQGIVSDDLGESND